MREIQKAVVVRDDQRELTVKVGNCTQVELRNGQHETWLIMSNTDAREFSRLLALALQPEEVPCANTQQ